MDKGLQNILNRIAEDTENKVLQSRFLTLASELPQAERLEAVLAIASVYVSAEPKEAIRLARMVREDHPQAYRDTAAGIIREALSAGTVQDPQPLEATQFLANQAAPTNSHTQDKKIDLSEFKSELEPAAFQFSQASNDEFTRPAYKDIHLNIQSEPEEKEVFAFAALESEEKQVIVLEGSSEAPELNENDTFVDLVLDQIPSSSNKSIEIARKQKEEKLEQTKPPRDDQFEDSNQKKTSFFTVDVEPTVSKMSHIAMTANQLSDKALFEDVAVEVDVPKALKSFPSRASYLQVHQTLPNTLEDKEVLGLLEYLYGDFPDERCVEMLQKRVSHASSFSLKAFYCVALVRNGFSRKALYFLQSAFTDVQAAQKEHLNAIYREIATSMFLPEQANYLERRVLPAYIRQVS